MASITVGCVIKRQHQSKGGVAAGDFPTLDAGIFALQSGGNAADAAVAAGLAACVVEPLLSGLGGGGVGLVRRADDGQVDAYDFFSDLPGEVRFSDNKPQLQPVSVDYGVTLAAKKLTDQLGTDKLQGLLDRGPGYTTHISKADAEGWLVSSPAVTGRR